MDDGMENETRGAQLGCDLEGRKEQCAPGRKEQKLNRYKVLNETVTRSPGETEQEPLSTRRLFGGKALVRVSGSTGWAG